MSISPSSLKRRVLVNDPNSSSVVSVRSADAHAHSKVFLLVFRPKCTKSRERACGLAVGDAGRTGLDGIFSQTALVLDRSSLSVLNMWEVGSSEKEATLSNVSRVIGLNWRHSAAVAVDEIGTGADEKVGLYVFLFSWFVEL